MTDKRRIINLSVRQRLILHRLLHRDLRKCSATALESFKRYGWTFGLGGAYQLTEKGRRIAEMSEQAAPDRELQLALPCSIKTERIIQSNSPSPL